MKEKFLIQVEPAAFYNSVNDKIALVEKKTLTADYTYVNVEKFISKGAELQTHFTMKNFHFNVGYNYTGVYNTFYGATGTSNLSYSSLVTC